MLLQDLIKIISSYLRKSDDLIGNGFSFFFLFVQLCILYFNIVSAARNGQGPGVLNNTAGFLLKFFSSNGISNFILVKKINCACCW